MFAHRLAMALGRTIAELDATMTRDEFESWGAYFEEEPWGCLVEDHRMGTLLSLLTTLNTKAGTKIPKWFDRRPDETLARMNAVTPEDEIEAMFDAMIARQTEPIT